MKKLSTLIIVLCILASTAVPAAAGGIYVASGRGDRVCIFEDTEITGQVDGNVISVLGDISVSGKVNGHVVAVFGDITVNSPVSGHVVDIFGKTVLGEPAVIAGDVISMGSLEKHQGSRILGREVRILGESMNLDIGAITYLQLCITLLFMLAVLVIGLLLILISKKKYTDIAANLERNVGRKIVLGILSFFGASALMLLLLITLAAPVLYVIILLLSAITACMFSGRFILRTFSRKNSIYMEFITGVISVVLIKLLIIFLVPQQEILFRLVLLALLDVLVFSTGLGIRMEQYYLKREEK
ncbi:MAG: hypothetical protein ACOX4M_03720 [Acetivibrionales bacterium]